MFLHRIPNHFGQILSNKPTFLTVLHFPDRITANFKWFYAPLAAFALALLLRSNPMLRKIGVTVSDTIKLHCDVDRQKQLQVKLCAY